MSKELPAPKVPSPAATSKVLTCPLPPLTLTNPEYSPGSVPISPTRFTLIVSLLKVPMAAPVTVLCTIGRLRLAVLIMSAVIVLELILAAAMKPAFILSALESVDYVVIFDEDTPYELISKVKPDILVKGADYEGKEVVGSDIAKETRLVDFIDGKSTTSTIDRILGQE